MNTFNNFDWLKSKIEPLFAPNIPKNQPVILIFSISNGLERAIVFNVKAQDFGAAWNKAESIFFTDYKKYTLEQNWLRIDLVTQVDTCTWEELGSKLKQTKRNYFRNGISLDSEFDYCFLEQELNANAMLYQGSKIPHAGLNQKNFSIYAKAKYKDLEQVDFALQKSLYVFNTVAIFYEKGELFEISATGLDIGRRKIAQLNEADVFDLVIKSSNYLAGQVKDNGQFVYGYFPCFDRPIANYNTLRHASSTYALVEAWELTNNPLLLVAIEKAINFLLDVCIKQVQTSSGIKLAFLIENGNEIKLGGNAVCILALVKYSQVSGTRQHDQLLEALASGIVAMQDSETGRFNHVLNFPELTVKETFRIIYYDGEAAFALLRLYDLTNDERWLIVVEQAFEYFIAQQHWKAHDHWLSYCVNELTQYSAEERYFRFGLQNFSDYLGFVINRETTFPTLLELMMAAEQMLRRIESNSALHHLLQEIDLKKFYRALHARAHHLLNGHFWPEFAMFFKCPNRIVNSFFIRHHSFRVRIDDIEHYLSGFIAYHRLLVNNLPEVTYSRFETESIQEKKGLGWNAEIVEQVTRGTWVVKPDDNWTMQGVCIAVKTFKPGQSVVIANGDENWGIPARLINRVQQAKAIICSDSDGLEKIGLPVLKVANCAQSVLHLGEYARKRFVAPVFGVTGSAGKTTTCSMLAHVLQGFGEVGQTAFSANLPHGIAWNMASIPWDVKNVVMELAIGRMPVNSQLVKPDVAIVTNIAPAHLEYHRTTEEIARKKSAIFNGMSENGYAVLFHEMNELAIFQKAAFDKRLRVITFGELAGADIRLMEYDMGKGEVNVKIFDELHQFKLGAPGKHMVLNSLAVIAAIVVSGQAISQVLSRFASFEAVVGRGALEKLIIDQKPITLLDESYNANPVSMLAMLDLCQRVETGSGRRVLILGDMLELGNDAGKYHDDLLEPLLAVKPDCVVLCGKMMKSLWNLLPPQQPSFWYEEVESLLKNILNLIQANDFVAVKSSNGTGLKQVVEYFKNQSSAGNE